MKRLLVLITTVLVVLPAVALADINPPGAGEEVVYQTVQSGANYRSSFNQVAGNAWLDYGD